MLTKLGQDTLLVTELDIIINIICVRIKMENRTIIVVDKLSA